MKTSGRNDKQRTCTYHDAHVARTTNNETFFFEFSHLRDLSLFGLIKRKTEINNNNNNNGGKASEEMAHSAQCLRGPGKFQIGWPTLTRRRHRRTPFIHPSISGSCTDFCQFVPFVRPNLGTVCSHPPQLSLPRPHYKCVFKLRTKFLAL